MCSSCTKNGHGPAGTLCSERRSGFTKVQLLVVILIISGLVGLLIPAVLNVLEAERRTQVINNLKQLALSLHSCNDVHKRLPPATGTFDMQTINMSLSVHLLPFIEQKPLYKSIIGNQPPTTAIIPPFVAPLDFTRQDDQRVQNFAANVRVFTKNGMDTLWNADVVPKGNDDDHYGAPAIPRTFIDGTSNVIVFSTRYANNRADQPGHGVINCSAYDAHYSPGSPSPGPFGAFFGAKSLAGPPTALSTGGFQLGPTITQANCAAGELAHSFGSAGIHVGLGDASVRTVAWTIESTIWNYEMCPNDGNPLGSDWGEF